jgi:hypothetical protein
MMKKWDSVRPLGGEIKKNYFLAKNSSFVNVINEKLRKNYE